MNALLIVDVQNDFLPGGLLPVPEGHQVIPIISMMAKDYDFIVASQDWHPLSHVSFKDPPGYHDGSWPVHCVRDTFGAGLAGDIGLLTPYRVLKGTDPEEEAYSAFAGNVFNENDPEKHDLGPLNAWLHNHEVTSVTVAGLALDYCVKATALDAVQAGYSTTVYIDATRPVSETAGVVALAELDDAGVKIRKR